LTTTLASATQLIATGARGILFNRLSGVTAAGKEMGRAFDAFVEWFFPEQTYGN
jgi:hypothetical protein